MSRHRHPALLGAWLIHAMMAGTSSADPVYFMGLGDLPGGTFESRAFGISADGTTVVGSSRSATGEQAFRWTLGSGMSGLGFLPGHSTSTAYGISYDGGVIVGGSGSGSQMQAFRWTIGAGMFGLGSNSSVARGVSGNGEVIVGQVSGATGTRGYRWTSGGGMETLPIPVNGSEGDAYAVSADGSYVVGTFSNESLTGRALRWTSGEMLNLGVVPGGFSDSGATGIGADGSIVTGWSFAPGGVRAFRWASTTGMVGLGLAQGVNGASFALGISADGSNIVGGSGVTANSANAFVWNSVTGMRLLSDILVSDLGLNLTGWTLGPAYGVSADGLTIVGSGINPSGNTEAWIAHIPEPTTLSHLVLAGIAILARRRSHR